MNKHHVNLQNASRRVNSPYGDVIKQIQEDAVCPFCPENLAKYHKKPITTDGKYWITTENMYPYEGTRHHALFIHKEHIEHIAEISPEAWVDLKKHIDEVVKDHVITGGGFVMRFGDTALTGGSVSHLHCMIIAGKGDQDILVKVG